MRSSPSIAAALPDDVDVYLVLNDFGRRLGRAWPETGEARTDRRSLITELLDGQYSDPVGSSLSTRLRAGRGTSPPRLPTKLSSAPVRTGLMCRHRCRTSWRSMQRGARCSCHCLSAASAEGTDLTKYYAYYVNVKGVTGASYELKGTNDADGVSEARHLLKYHPSIEVWQGARFVARIVRNTPRARGH
jgi:hypothetical protein